MKPGGPQILKNATASVTLVTVHGCNDAPGQHVDSAATRVAPTNGYDGATWPTRTTSLDATQSKILTVTVRGVSTSYYAAGDDGERLHVDDQAGGYRGILRRRQAAEPLLVPKPQVNASVKACNGFPHRSGYAGSCRPVVVA